jgi:hypothetical protein
LETLLLAGFGRQKPNNYSQREHENSRNQMISLKVRARAKIGDMLHQKRQAAQRQQPAHCYFVPQPTNSGSLAIFTAIRRAFI